MAELTTKLLSRLKAWCEAERGRKVQVAHYLGIDPQALSNLFADRQQLTGEQALKILEFLKTHGRSK